VSFTFQSGENAMKLGAAVAALVLAFSVAAPVTAQQPASATLYKRLGGYDAMASPRRIGTPRSST
jgi:hypothetical protein